MKRFLIAFALTISFIVVHAAQTDRVDYLYLGIQFSIPTGWQGSENGETFVMGSNSESGLLAIMLNSAKTPTDLKTEADNGIIDEYMQLTRSSDFMQVGAEGLGAEFSGYVEGQAAKAFIIGLINPFGQSVTVGAVTSKQQYTNRYQKLALELANSVAFATPKESQKTQEWRDWMNGRRLTYMYSSYSSGSNYYDSSGQTYGSYSSSSQTTKIDLCSDGTFAYYSSDQTSFDSVGGFGGSSSGNDSGGQWKVSTLASGEASLTLQFSNGEIHEYDLRYTNEKVYLNGTRYFGTSSPYCH